MKMKYMRVKVITIPFLTLLILVSTITGCAPVNSQETIDIIKDYGDTVQIEVIERKDHPNIHLGDKEYRVDTTPTTTPTPDPIETPDNTFTVPIDTIDNIDETPEITDGFKVEEGVTALPEQTQQQVQVQLFKETQETRYTNTSANLRSSYTVNSNKIITLPVNTELKVIATGISGTEAAGWLKVSYNSQEVFISESLTSTSKIEIHQPVQVDRPAQQPIQTQQPAQKPSQTYKSNEDELDAAIAAIGAKPAKDENNDNPKGPVVVTNTELILPD